MNEKDIESFYPKNQQQWRKWLQKNHEKKQSIWLIYYKKSSGVPTISWSEAVDEALCFGWIDSTKKTLDEERSIQFFTKRKARSTWSKINKAKVQKLIEEGSMMAAGLKIIELAKENGSWSVLDEVEELTVPIDLEEEFKKHPGSKTYFLGLSKSVKKMILQWLVLAKRTETRQKRIAEIAELAAQKLKPKQFR